MQAATRLIIQAIVLQCDRDHILLFICSLHLNCVCLLLSVANKSYLILSYLRNIKKATHRLDEREDHRRHSFLSQHKSTKPVKSRSPTQM